MGKLTKRPDGYDELLANLVAEVQTARFRAGLAVNRELVGLYWRIGQAILESQARQGWGARVVDRLAADLRQAFPEMRGFSVRNLKYMRALAHAWPDEEFVQQLLHKLPWGHLVRLLDKVDDAEQRVWYAQQAAENGWSRKALEHHIERDLYHTRGSATTNFHATLPAPRSELAREILKDPYKLDFLGVGEDAAERSIEIGLVAHIRDFLIELGHGFAFVGNQVPLEIGDDEFRIDLLFYHLKLRCFVVIELKAGQFRPEHAGKLNFYLSAVDDLLRHPDDQPSIGLILCRGRDRIVAEYALRGMTQPLGVSTYELTKTLPEKLRGELPSVEELEAELEDARIS